MDFSNILINLFTFLSNSFISPLIEYLDTQWGVSLSNISFSLGLGSITWLTTDLQTLIVVVFSIFIDAFVLRLIYLTIRSFVRLIRR